MMITIVTIFTAVTGNYLLFRFFGSKQINDVLLCNKKAKPNEIKGFLLSKLAGFLLLGLIPAIIIFSMFPLIPEKVGLTIGQTKNYWYTSGIIAIIIVFIHFQAKHPKFYSRYPEISPPKWTKTAITFSILGWTIYLFGYEFLFRGLLFFTVYHSLGLIPAFSINILIYSAAHLTKGKTEFICAFPFGILLCYISLISSSIILPFLIHLSLALSANLFSIHFNPKIVVI